MQNVTQPNLSSFKSNVNLRINFNKLIILINYENYRIKSKNLLCHVKTTSPEKVVGQKNNKETNK